MKKVYLFKRYERFWHWMQALLVITLLLTGFSIHGPWRPIPFEIAIRIHEAAGLALVVLIGFTMFWHLTSGEGKQFIPTRMGFADQVRFYTSGIFRSASNPNVAKPEDKFNPVQKLAYFSLLVLVFPVQIATGLLYWSWHRWEFLRQFDGALPIIAMVHTASAFAMFIFLIIHLYMLTTGHSFGSHLKAMITGWADEDSNEPSQD